MALKKALASTCGLTNCRLGDALESVSRGHTTALYDFGSNGDIAKVQQCLDSAGPGGIAVDGCSLVGIDDH